MVKNCTSTYLKQHEEEYKPFFDLFSFPLSPFQKWSIHALINGHHTLTCAHTGSGKTVVAEFAIQHFINQGKKVIYTSPIKALSNQKFNEFTTKFKNISFGILTGDIKFNPEADVLIVTAEILLNQLYQSNNSNKVKSSFETFQMNLDIDLGCVIMDEVHYINDSERGRVWEETIMLIPKQTQLVMLSATIDNPIKFADWCEQTTNKGATILDQEYKEVYLTTTEQRLVPLTHFSYITCTTGIFKKIKDKTIETQIKNSIDEFILLQDAKGKIYDENYYKMTNVLNIFKKKDYSVKRQHVLNNVTKLLVEKEMLPAICFVLSRKMLEECAKDITTDLLEFDSKVPYIVRNECEKIIRKLPNFEEYLFLPEYLSLVALLEKGIAIHHAGIMPILREMVEILFAKGYIKLLFATETFAVGINMPTKTVLFTSHMKFDGNGNRYLYSHEFTQMSGRAGRRGIDTVGHVIHLHNLFKENDITCVRTMMSGNPQLLASKFKVSNSLVLNMLAQKETNITTYFQKSMLQQDIQSQLLEMQRQMNKDMYEISRYQDQLHIQKTPENVIKEYLQLKENVLKLSNKKRKEAERKIESFKIDYPSIDKDAVYVEKIETIKKKVEEMESSIYIIKSNLKRQSEKLVELLRTSQFVEINEDVYNITLKGQVALQIREVHSLIFTDLLIHSRLNELSTIEFVAFLSTFTSIRCNEDVRTYNIDCIDGTVELKNLLRTVQEQYIYYEEFEAQNNLNTGESYDLQWDIVNEIMEWCKAEDAGTCKILLERIQQEKNIFLGEFIKAILKINNVTNEIITVCELIGNIEMLQKCKDVSSLTLKFVATNQSLYV